MQTKVSCKSKNGLSTIFRAFTTAWMKDNITNPFGQSLNSPIAAQWMFEFQIRCRIMQGDKKYNFVALGDNYLVDSKLGHKPEYQCYVSIL